jgi:hypothetical protein
MNPITLLSRIDGDAPAPEDQRRTFGWFESRLVSHIEAALLEHPNQILRTQPFRRSRSDSQLLFIPK